MTSVKFRCESTEEADVLRLSVNQYGTVALPAMGIDPRTYAMPTRGSAGFGWDAVREVAYKMGQGVTVTMSARMAEAVRAALTYKAQLRRDTQAGRDKARAEMAGRLATRMASCVRESTGGSSRVRRSSQAIAMDLRFHVYASEPGATCDTYPSGPGGLPVPLPYSAEQRAENALRRDAVLAEWAETDPAGHDGWRRASAELANDSSAPKDGWAAQIFEVDGIRLVDPCAHCRECRSRR
ncbi:hypothetical protein GA0115243_104768 [Streptomyces sp. ScaeMP-e83]|nr:hypothetical protein GA0115243_104768 [Streptomyces sp. ScaeMP-e83]